jgi:hypothetical protein
MNADHDAAGRAPATRDGRPVRSSEPPRMETQGMRKALVIGIDQYDRLSRLHGCVNDAAAVAAVLECHADGSPNFGVHARTASSADDAISRGDLMDLVESLFSDDSEIALLYFAGHGHLGATGGYLCTSETRRGDDGLALSEVMTLALQSKAQNKIIVLDSCHSGEAGNLAGFNTAQLPEGMSILTASTSSQYASESKGQGVFTALFVDALQGAAANLVGDVTPGSVYAHIDQSLGPWGQRPVFKTNVKRFVSLRCTPPSVALAELRAIPQLFPTVGYQLPLDPSFEPDPPREAGWPAPNPTNTATFALLQRLAKVNLVVPVGETHMYYAAVRSKSCRLTPLGEHYRRLAIGKRI